VAHGHLSKPISVIVPDGPTKGETSFGDHALAITKSTMARRAVNVKSLLASQKKIVQLPGAEVHGGGQSIDPFAIDLSGVVLVVHPEMAASDGSRDQGKRSSSIGVELGSVKGFSFGLTPHIGMAASEKNAGGEK
jgi:hypothetical protein